MTLNEYFENTEGMGVLATADGTDSSMRRCMHDPM